MKERLLTETWYNYFRYRHVETGSEAHPASSTMCTRDPFPGVKAWPGRDADHSPPSNAEVENEQELYLLSPKRVVSQL
jgi:hypothetical protein